MLEDETDDVIAAAMWAYVAQYHAQLTRMCLKAARGDEQYAEELFSDEVLRMLPNLIERWDGVRSFHAYASSYFSLHLRKIFYRKQNKQHSSIEQMREQAGWDVETLDLESKLEVDDLVESLLSRLDPIERVVICLTKMHSYSYREVATKLHKSHGFVAKVVQEAMRKLRV